MRKIFTLAAAVLASFSLMAEDVTLVDINFKDASWTGKTFAQKGSNTPDVINGIYFYSKNSDDAKQFSLAENETKGLRFPGNNIKSDNYFFAIPLTDVHEYIEVTLTHEYSESKASFCYVFADGLEEFSSSIGTATAVKDEKDASTSITFKVDATKEKGFLYIGRQGSNFTHIVGVKVVSQKDAVVDPVLSVNPEEVTLAATAAKPSDEATVTFSGKNLAEGEYALTVPDLAGLSINPVAVSVGADGKLNQQVTIAYSSDIDVDPANTEISLKIGELVAKVSVNYSASLAKHYLSKSVNIEQLVLDNGKSFDIESEFRAANIEFENLNELDSLNDEKSKRNEPYLGLKLKKQGAFVACWLKEGDRIAIKFGAVKAAVKIGVNGEYQDYPASDESSSIEKTAEQDEYLEIIAQTNDKTIVIKQIMLNEDIATVILPDVPSAIDNIEAGEKAIKTIENGQLVIIKNGVRYNAQGVELR